MKKEKEAEGFIEGEKINLRFMTVEDTDLIVAWRNKQFVKERYFYQKPFTREGHLRWIKTKVQTGKVVQFIILTKEGVPVGSVFLRDIDRLNHKAEYGIFIGEETALGRGYGSEAAKIIIRYAFEELEIHKLFLRVMADNVRAIKSYENAGFVREAYLKDEVFLNQKYRDVVLMAVINPREILK